MAKKTKNYNLTKPEPTDFYDVEVQNGNMDIIDEELKKANENAGDMSKSTYDKNGDGVVDNAEKINGKTDAQIMEESRKISSQLATDLGIGDTPNVEAAIGRVNGKIKELYPTLTVNNTIAGKTITATDGATSLTATTTGTTHKFTLPNRGNWTVTYEGLSKAVSVPYNGDYSIAPGYEQLINYTMLYNQGDECVGVTDGWEKGYVVNSGGKLTKTSSALVVTGSEYYNVAVNTRKGLDVGNFSKLLSVVTTSDNTNALVGMMLLSQRGGTPTSRTEQVEIIGIHSKKTFLGKDISTQSGLLYPAFFHTRVVNTSDALTTLRIYNVFLTKQDDWRTWMSKGGVSGFRTLDSLLSNMSAMNTLMSNADAVEFMIKRMTGDVMGGVVQSDIALSALNSSPYKTKVQANPHWSKFLAMVV